MNKSVNPLITTLATTKTNEVDVVLIFSSLISIMKSLLGNQAGRERGAASPMTFTPPLAGPIVPVTASKIKSSPIPTRLESLAARLFDSKPFLCCYHLYLYKKVFIFKKYLTKV